MLLHSCVHVTPDPALAHNWRNFLSHCRRALQFVYFFFYYNLVNPRKGYVAWLGTNVLNKRGSLF